MLFTVVQPPHPSLASLNLASMVSVAVSVAVVLVLQEEVLVAAVGGKGHRRDAQAGERALEAVPSGEDALVSPRLAVRG